jgi:hypothetical protein
VNNPLSASAIGQRAPNKGQVMPGRANILHRLFCLGRGLKNAGDGVCSCGLHVGGTRPRLLRARLNTANELAAQKAERYLTSQQSRYI